MENEMSTNIADLNSANMQELTSNIQKEIEKIIKNNIDGYVYGTRRENQNDEINKSLKNKLIEFIFVLIYTTDKNGFDITSIKGIPLSVPVI